MLQQTRVVAVLPYYQRFLRRFPNVRALARARTDEVLRYWAGLGYYRRARHLKAAAREIVRRHNGFFPEDYEKVLALPGIGRYTAAAILSIAYGQAYAVIDGNVARVLARLACLDGDIHRVSYRKELEALAAHLLPHGTPGDFNQAMMELGATVCVPRRPICERCPVELFCRARQKGLETLIPGKRRKPERREVHLAVAVAESNGKVLLVRERGGFFSGLWQFPSARSNNGRSLRTALRELLAQCGGRARVARSIGEARHSVTHHDLHLHVFRAQLEAPAAVAPTPTRLVSLEHLERLPVSSATRKIVRLYQQHREELRKTERDAS